LPYFAKPNFIVYEEWFDNNFKITPDEKKIQKQSNYKVGASKNNLKIDIYVKRGRTIK